MRLVPYFLVFLLVFVSCGHREEVYEDLMLVDLHIAESVLEKHKAIMKGTVNYTDPAYAGLFEQYGVSYVQFDSSFTYYQVHLDLYDEMYDEVVRELTKLSNKEEDVMKRRGLIPVFDPNLIERSYQEDSVFIGPFFIPEHLFVADTNFADFQKLLPSLLSSLPSR